MQLDRLLESQSFFHNVSILDGDHAVVYISRVFHLLRLFLVVKARVASAEWVHLVALADLETQGAHLVFQQLIVKVRAWAGVLSNLF